MMEAISLTVSGPRWVTTFTFLDGSRPLGQLCLDPNSMLIPTLSPKAVAGALELR